MSMPLPSLPTSPDAKLILRGGRPLTGTAPLVGDKSISHRALLLAALADGPTRIANLSPCADVGHTLSAIRALGVVADELAAGTVVVHGRGVRGLAGDPVRLDCGDSGTTMRLLAGVLAGQERSFTLTAAPGLAQRPMGRVTAPLRAMGAAIGDNDGRPPLRGSGAPADGGSDGEAGDAWDRRLGAIAWDLPYASAQVASAILLAGLNATGTTIVRSPSPVRDHTERLLAAMGAPISWDGRETRLEGPVARLTPPYDGHLLVPDDLSAAAFLLAAATLVPGSRVTLTAVGVNDGRVGLLDILAQMGAPVARSDGGLRGSEPVATLTATSAPLRGVAVGGALVPRTIDELPLVAVLASQAHGRTVLRDAAELRVKESDRVAAICNGLARLGAAIEATPDGFEVEGPRRLVGAAVDGCGDHRVVMALAIAGLAADGETTVSDAGRVADSYPGFVAALQALGGDVRLNRGAPD